MVLPRLKWPWIKISLTEREKTAQAHRFTAVVALLASAAAAAATAALCARAVTANVANTTAIVAVGW
jgi:hypothetical protein